MTFKHLILLAGVFMLSCQEAPPQTPGQTGSDPVSISSRVYGPNADTPWNLPGKAPHLIAHYLPWFEGADHKWDHWQWQHPQADHDPSRVLANNMRDIASVNYPLIGPYASDERNVIRYHLATMQAAGIDALAVLWYGPNNRVDARIPTILDEALKLNMRVAICYEEKLNWPPYRGPEDRDTIVQTATADLTYLIEHYTSHGAYLRRNNVPYIFQFNYWGAGELGPNNILPGEWEVIFKALPQPVVYGRQNLDEAYHPTIPAAYVWWTQDDWPVRFANRSRQLIADNRLHFFMSMICPGFDNHGVWGWSGTPMRSTLYGMPELNRTCDQAMIGNPELIQIVTWNDFNEGTVIEPTIENGFAFVDAIEIWWNKISGRPINLLDNKAAFEEYVKTCSPVQRNLLPVVLSENNKP